MTTTRSCESCGMPIETGRYCAYCTDESGQLQSFDERFERMVAWQARRDPARHRARSSSARPSTTWPPCPPGATTPGPKP